MIHPFFKMYLIESYVINGGADRADRVPPHVSHINEQLTMREGLKRILVKPNKIMSWHWLTLAKVTGIKYHVFKDVYERGWDFSQDTENLKTLFESFLIERKFDLKQYL